MSVDALPRTAGADSALGQATLAVTSLGSALPRTRVGNAAVASSTGTSSEWIRRRTGMIERAVREPVDSTASLAAAAGAAALRDAAALPDLLILATTTPDRPVPATAVDVQARLALPGRPAFDLNSACSGFLYGLAMAVGAHATGLAEHVLLIGADTFTRHVDPTDRRTAPLFGDGAGAVFLSPAATGFGVLSVDLWADGTMSDHAYVPGWTAGDDGRRDHLFRMDGRAVKQVVLSCLPDLLVTSLRKNGLDLPDVDRFIVHQANPVLVRMLAEALSVDPRRMPTPGKMTGNTAAASVPMALAASHRDRPIPHGAVVVLLAAGAGMSAGVAVLRWV